MGFENNNMEVALKVSHGNEIRRIALQGPSYDSLLQKTAELFALDATAIVLKYQDDEEDRIVMSSDAEFQEAVRVARNMNKVLRLFVEAARPPAPVAAPAAQGVHAPAPAPVEPVQAAADEPDLYLGPGGSRFGFNPRGGLHYHAPHFGHGPFGRGGHFVPGAGPFGAHGEAGAGPFAGPAGHWGGGPWGRGGMRPHHGPFQHRRPHNDWYVTRGHFNPQATATDNTAPLDANASSEQVRQRWRDECKQLKEHKRMMKESFKEMARDATTEEDLKALKELKHQMKNDIRQAKHSLFAGMKYDKDYLKALRVSEKEGKKNWKKEDKEEWKKMKKERKEKKERYVARHVEDVTIPDGTELPPNTPFLKTWKIRNEGPAWPTGCQLLFVSHKGDNLNGPERVVIKGDVLPGQEVEVSVPLITPAESGRYVGYYRMVTPDGVKFGQRVWVSFVVKRDGDATMLAPADVNAVN